jgi:hypothetical protein
LQRADDNGFARTGFSRYGDKTRRNFPFKLFHESEIFYAQQSEDGGHRRKLMVVR